jgi:hypothetical protein
MAGFMLTVRDLRRQWKPHKLRLQGHPTSIRFHRACSWLARAEELAGGVNAPGDTDLQLLSQWIALNSLYGEWDEHARMPVNDCECWKAFIDRVLKLDQTLVIQEILTDHRQLVEKILLDPYVSKHFWQDPTLENARQVARQKRQVQSMYFEKRWLVILERLLERIYLVRCQLAHGGATWNGKLNRSTVERCSRMLDRLVRGFLLIWIRNGADECWGTMCYPPIRRTANQPAANHAGRRAR